jgi:hypothetical protein
VSSALPKSKSSPPVLAGCDTTGYELPNKSVVYYCGVLFVLLSVWKKSKVLEFYYTGFYVCGAGVPKSKSKPPPPALLAPPLFALLSPMPKKSVYSGESSFSCLTLPVLSKSLPME